MSCFCVETKLSHDINQLGTINKDIKNGGDRLQSVSNKLELSGTSGAQVKQNLFQILGDVADLNKKMQMLQDSLQQIYDTYSNTEKSIAEMSVETHFTSEENSKIQAVIDGYMDSVSWENQTVAMTALQLLAMLKGNVPLSIILKMINNYRNRTVKAWINTIDDKSTRELLSQNLDYARVIMDRYNQAEGTAKELFDKYKDDIVLATLNSNGSKHQNGKLYIDKEKNMKDPRGADNVFYHESGHFIVYKEGWVSNQTISSEFSAFDNAVKNDVSNYIASIENEQRSALQSKYSGAQLEQMVTQRTREYLMNELDGDNRHSLNGVSDMIDAASNGKYKITYGHDLGYWDANPTRQANEAFAEMYTADFCNNDHAEIDYIREHFPNAYQEYENLKNSALGR